jgi:hypothetical protein
MSRRLIARRLTAVGGALILAAGLAGCGKVGLLEPAAPLFGHKTPARVPQGQDPHRPIETVDPRDRTTDGAIPPPPGAEPGPTQPQ